MQTQDRKRKANFLIDDETECDDSNDGVIRSILVLIVSSILTISCSTLIFVRCKEKRRKMAGDGWYLLF